jgi:hypothetical protein
MKTIVEGSHDLAICDHTHIHTQTHTQVATACTKKIKGSAKLRTVQKHEIGSLNPNCSVMTYNRRTKYLRSFQALH